MDHVSTPPSSIGTRGRFWDVTLDGFERNPDNATVAVVVIEAPYANQSVHSFFISIVHLRNHPGFSKPAVLHRPDATHEIALFPLAPTQRRDTLLRGKASPEFVRPDRPTYVGQLALKSDVEAHDVLLQIAQDVADGKLNPDKDYLKWWAARCGTHCLKPGWDRWSDKFIVDGKEIIVPLRPGPGEIP